MLVDVNQLDLHGRFPGQGVEKRRLRP
jgi:hypothetical protein